MKKTVNRALIAAFIVLFYMRFISGGVIGSSAPFPADKFSVIVVANTDDLDDIPTSQLNAINSTDWRKYVMDKGGQLRVLPPNHDTTKEAKWVQDGMAVERESEPWLLISNGKSGFSGPFPEDLSGMMAAVKKVGGE